MAQELVLLGIDGIGKSTIAAALMQCLRSEGKSAIVTSWSSSSRNHPSKFERQCMNDALFVAFRCMYAAASTRDGPACRHFPDSAESFFAWEDMRNVFLDMDIVKNEAWGVLSGALAEIAGNFMFRYFDVVPNLKRGCLVIQETFGYKHLVKDLYLSKMLALRNGDLEFVPLVEKLAELGEWMYSTVLAPEVGIVIDGDPVPAIERRMAQSGRAGWTENMQLACDSSPESFLHMQQYTRDKFLAYAKRYGWPVITITEEGKEQNTNRAIEIIRNALQV